MNDQRRFRQNLTIRAARLCVVVAVLSQWSNSPWNIRAAIVALVEPFSEAQSEAE